MRGEDVIEYGLTVAIVWYVKYLFEHLCAVFGFVFWIIYHVAVINRTTKKVITSKIFDRIIKHIHMDVIN